jgi:hypothetical protein
MPNTSLSIAQILAVLEATPTRIAELTAGLTEAQLHAPPTAGEWSITEVLAHLRACGDVWGNSIVTMLKQDRPTIRAINPRTWITGTHYLEQQFRPSFHAFTAQRAELLAILRPLRAKSWARSATVTGAGKPLELSVQSYAQRMARHERPHLKQIKHIADAIRES